MPGLAGSGGSGRDGLLRPALLDESQGRDGGTRTRPGFKGWRGTECRKSGQPPEAGRIALFGRFENRTLGSSGTAEPGSGSRLTAHGVIPIIGLGISRTHDGGPASPSAWTADPSKELDGHQP